MKKEYVVSLNRDVDYDKFWNEMETNTEGLFFIPDRQVEIINNRDGSLRSCHYSLTDEEAELLRKDSRIYSVEIPPDQRTDIKISLNILSQTGDFTKPSVSTGQQINWGLVRSSNPTNVYGSNVYPSANVYYYDFDGSGVDVVIQDSGIEDSHPEFQDNQGISRVQKINWYTASGLAGTQNANHYRDYDGHGTHVAGIAAGKTFGWAKNANIYSIKVNGLEGTGDSGTGIPIADCFDVIKLWHQNKPTDPITGAKRPTVVNASWGYTSSIANTSISSIVYRGNSYTGSDIFGYVKKLELGLPAYGILTTNVDDVDTYIISARVNSVDVDVQELIDAGVHFIHSAGNNYAKSDLPGGLDHNNYLLVSGTPYYYNRGMSPLSANAIMVGAIDTTVNSALDRKVNFSNTGEIYAPGVRIRSCVSNTNAHSGVTYAFGHTGYKQVNLSGTSQAGPQIAGISALYLQNNPNTSPFAFKNWLTNTGAITNIIYTTNSSNDYSNYNSLMGSPNKMAYSNIFAAIQQSTIQVLVGSGSFNNISLTYT